MIGVQGKAEGEEGDPLWVAVPLPLDRPALPGPIEQPRREDLQVISFLQALAFTGVRHPLEVRPGEDPPDRYLRNPEKEWATELTELTLANVRVDLARARSVGRELSGRLEGRLTDFLHLRGRVITLSHAPEGPDAPIPSDTEEVLTSIEEALVVDKGCVGDGVDYSQGFPKQLPQSGMYGQIGPFHVLVQRDEGTAISVSATAQAQIQRSEAVKALAERIERKDDPRNTALLVTCGLPDYAGYTCPFDVLIFKAIEEAAGDGALLGNPPEHLKAVALHLFQTGQWIEVFRAPGVAALWTN